MIHFKDYDFSGLFDRPDLVYCPYIAALDIQYAHNLPYLWTFTFDSCVDQEGNAVIIGGRTFDDLLEFLETMKAKLHLSNGKRKHYLVIIVDDLFTFSETRRRSFHMIQNLLLLNQDLMCCSAP